jgi:hypothetical protein
MAYQFPWDRTAGRLGKDGAGRDPLISGFKDGCFNHRFAIELLKGMLSRPIENGFFSIKSGNLKRVRNSTRVSATNSRFNLE